MAFQVSPGVQVREIDLTTIIPAVSTTIAGFAGRFQWGPVGQRITVNKHQRSSEVFQGPNDDNFNLTGLPQQTFLATVVIFKLCVLSMRTTSKSQSGTSQGFLSKITEDYESKSSRI